LEHVDTIEARSIIFTWATQALVNVDVAMIARKARSAEAIVTTLIIKADTFVAQGRTVQRTLVYIDIAILTCDI